MKTRTVVIIVVIVAFVVLMAFAGLVIIVGLAGDSDIGFVGFGPKVAIVEIQGQIMDSRYVVQQLERWEEDGNIKAIVLHINSPGGGVAASQEIYDQVLRVRDEGIPVVASFASVAASGGYYIACAADKIVSNPGSLTGSIGVILQYLTYAGLMDKIGVDMETIESGDLKDVGNPSREMSPEEELMLQAVIDDSYQQFVEAVALGRNRPKEEIYPLADGSIFTGRQAYNLGLVDTLGTLQDAINLAGELGGIGPDPDVVRQREPQPGFLDLLTGTALKLQQMTGPDNTGMGIYYLHR